MKLRRFVSLTLKVTLAAGAGLVVASIATSLAWEALVYEKAFHCSDDTGSFLGFMGGVDGHRQASDILASGWTWEKIESSRKAHVAMFWILFAAPAVLTCFRIRKPMP